MDNVSKAAHQPSRQSQTHVRDQVRLIPHTTGGQAKALNVTRQDEAGPSSTGPDRYTTGQNTVLH